MKPHFVKNLEEARELFYSHRLIEAYNILRRFYDRLPFEQHPEHADYIGMFARVLAELGKEQDLRFYLTGLERLYDLQPSPVLGYQLGFVYTYLRDAQAGRAKIFFEEILSNPAAKRFHIKAKLMLADYYDTIGGDPGACQRVINSIEEVTEPDLRILVEIWRAKVLKDHGSFEIAEVKMKEILRTIELPRNWYAYYSVQIVLADLYLKMKRLQDAESLIESVRVTFESNRFRSMREQLDALEQRIIAARQPLELELTLAGSSARIDYENIGLHLDASRPAEKFLLLLATQGLLNKSFIARNILGKNYQPETDDKQIYHLVHQARKKLHAAGIPKDVVESVENGYRFVPKIRITGPAQPFSP